MVPGTGIGIPRTDCRRPLNSTIVCSGTCGEMVGLRKRHNPTTGSASIRADENADVEPIDEDDQIKLISELREQAIKDYEYQTRAINYVCIFTAGISLYLSEYHEIPVGIIFR